MKNQIIGTLMIGIALLILITLISYNMQINSLTDKLMDSSESTCFVNGECIHKKGLLPAYTGGIGFVLLILLGVYLAFFEKEEKNKIVNAKTVKQLEPKKITKAVYKKVISSLNADEKLVFEELIKENGAAFQSNLVDKTKFTKVKVTRILDKLEGRGLIERKRRGMTNVVIVK